MSNTRDKILNSAIVVFAAKGKHGAGMEEIALHAGVNKAMVYYYFKTKENLHNEVLKHLITEIIHRRAEEAGQLKIDPNDPIALVKLFTRTHFTTVSKNGDMVKIFLTALTSEPETIKKVIDESMEGSDRAVIGGLTQILSRGIAEKKLRNVNPTQLFLSILGMNLFFIFGKPMAEAILGLKIEDEELFLEERLNSIMDLVLYGIVNRS